MTSSDIRPPDFDEEADPRNVPQAIREKILFFDQLIERKTEGFVGRQWLFDTIEEDGEGDALATIPLLFP